MDPLEFQKELGITCDNLWLKPPMEALATVWNQKAARALNKITPVHLSWSISPETPYSLQWT